jgi:hypothetical protein
MSSSFSTTGKASPFMEKFYEKEVDVLDPYRISTGI